MRIAKSHRLGVLGLVAIGAICASHLYGRQVDPAKAAELQGGLVVQLGASEAQAVAELSLTGRYLIHVLDVDAERIDAARSRLREDGHYGLAWAEHVSDTSRLPYAENIVNLIVVRDYTVGVDELSRVLTTVANGTAFVTRPNAHELIAIDTSSGGIRWRFTANGRLDTPPAIHRGLCLFGSATGWVYALRADSGELVWRLRAAPTDERIVAYGQVESPWPVPGAVLVMDDIAYFAAGRQPLADGGILVFAVNPLTGERHWVTRIDSVPQKGFYENSGLEFDPFDILHAEGDGLAMSRWILSPDGKDISVDKWNAFAKLNTGAGEVWIPRGAWTYGARHQHRFRGEAPRRPLIAFRDDNVYSSLDGSTHVFRRDFDLDKGEEFNSKWITGWQAAQEGSKGGKPYRTYRIAEGSKWTNDPFADPGATTPEPAPGTQLQNRIHAMTLAGDKLYTVHQDGRLKVMSTSNGQVMNETHVPPPAWDGLVVAENRLYLSTQSGELVCLGE